MATDEIGALVVWPPSVFSRFHVFTLRIWGDVSRPDWFRLVSKFENELHRTTPPQIWDGYQLWRLKALGHKGPWVTTGCPGATLRCTTNGPRGSVGNANGQGKWGEQARETHYSPPRVLPIGFAVFFLFDYWNC